VLARSAEVTQAVVVRGGVARWCAVVRRAVAGVNARLKAAVQEPAHATSACPGMLFAASRTFVRLIGITPAQVGTQKVWEGEEGETMPSAVGIGGGGGAAV